MSLLFPQMEREILEEILGAFREVVEQIETETKREKDDGAQATY